MTNRFEVLPRQELEISISHNCLPVVTRIHIDILVRDPVTRVCLVRSLVQLPHKEAIALFETLEAELKTLGWLSGAQLGQ